MYCNRIFSGLSVKVRKKNFRACRKGPRKCGYVYCILHVHIQRKCFPWFQCNCVFMLGLIRLVRENQKNENIIVLAFSLDVHVCNKLCFILKPVHFLCATRVSYRVILLKWATNIFKILLERFKRSYYNLKFTQMKWSLF